MTIKGRFTMTKNGLLLGLLISLSILKSTEGHGHLQTPRTRNYFAYEEGTDAKSAGVPEKEYCSTCLNRKQPQGTCGAAPASGTDYDNNVDSNGDPMPWNPQEFYVEGQEIEVSGVLVAHHEGHIEMYACANHDNPTQECFNQNPLTLVRDELNGGPIDVNYPQRGYLSKDNPFDFTFRLPMGVHGRVLLQWIYVTANTCKPEGYDNPDLDLAGRGWFSRTNINTCGPYDLTGAGPPERFWNCAEVDVTYAGPTSSPRPTSVGPPPSPVAAPSTPQIGWCCWSDCCNGTPGDGSNWCDSEDRCSGCGGQMCYADAPPTPTAPVAPPPTTPTWPTPPAPVPSPVAQPSTPSPEACCTRDFKNCNTQLEGWCSESKQNCEGACNKFWLPNGPVTGCTARYEPCSMDSECCGNGMQTCQGGMCELSKTPVQPVTTPPVASPVTPPTSPTPPNKMFATTTRYWDCSGGSCGCAYLPSHLEGDNNKPAHCHSNAMFEAPTNNAYGAKFYGTAAISAKLGGDDWLGEGCGKCWKVKGTSNVQGYEGVATTMILKGTNYCPPGNFYCAGDNAHFDISAPGFDVTQYSLSNTCEEREPDEIEGFESCGKWLIGDNWDKPDENCDCSLFKSPVLRKGCENFFSLKWDNAMVEYEEVECPSELSRLNCWEENNDAYPPFPEVPQFCAWNTDDAPAPTPTPPAPTPTPPAPTTPSNCPNADEMEMNIEIKGDTNSGKDKNKWTLQRYNGTAKNFEDLVFSKKIGKKKPTKWSECVPKDDCYILHLLDKTGNGIPTGHYKVEFGDISIDDKFANGDMLVEMINCGCNS